MVFAKGYLNLGGIKKEATFGTPVLLGAGNGFEYNSESLAAKVDLLLDQQVQGKASMLSGSKGNEMYSGDIDCDARYEGMETMVALAMGTAGAPAQQGVSLAYKHVLKIADDTEGLFATIGFWLQGLNVREFVSSKFGGFEFSVKQGERAKIKYSVCPQKLNINTGAGTNTTTTAATITLPTNRDFLSFGQLAIRCNNQGAAGLAGADLIYPSAFSIKVDNKLAMDDVTTRYGTLIDEPLRDGFVEVTGSLEFTKYGSENHQLFLDMISKARKKMDVVFTGPVASAPYNYGWTFYLPDLQFSEGSPNTDGPGRLGFTLNFSAYRTSAAPTGFPVGYTDALTIEMVSTKQTDALA